MGLFVYKMAYEVFFLEDFCSKQAHQIVGENWAKEIPATSLDYQNRPDIIRDGKIYAGMHES